MNLAAFLHSTKEYKDQSIPLPLAPVYSLPQHKWIFSSPNLVPLRKRKQNASLYKYISEFQALTEQRQTNIDDKQLANQTLLCLYQKNSYMKAKLKHVFETIWASCCGDSPIHQKISCSCQSKEQQGARAFKIGSRAMGKYLQMSKKNSKSDIPVTKHDQINWFEFTRVVVHEQLSIPLHNEDQLHLFKFPSNNQKALFSIVWNNSYIVFNNGSQVQINQRMKSKAVQLMQLIAKRLQSFLWQSMQPLIQHVAEQIVDNDSLVDRMKKIITPSSFRVWFYKKQTNNQIYVVSLSDLSLKGVECTFFKDVNLKEHINHVSIEIPYFTAIPQDLTAPNVIAQTDQFINSKIKSYSMKSKSNKSLLAINRQKLKSLADANTISCKTLEMKVSPSKVPQVIVEVTDIQCACCKYPLVSTEIVNEITAKHVEQIRYLRQMKIGKQEYQPYDFVKVCTQCYQVYLKHQQVAAAVKMKQKKTVSFYEYKKTKEQLKGKEKTISHSKLEHKESRMTDNSRTKQLKNQPLKLRTKSQLNTSKEHTDADSVSVHNIKMRLPVTNLPPRQRKVNTNYSSSNDYSDVDHTYQIASIKQEFSIDRTLTDHQQPITIQLPRQVLPKSKSFKLRGRIPSKCPNIINRVILNDSSSVNALERQLYQQDSKMVKNQILTEAIHEYESTRPSFKKLVYKNHRPYLKRQLVIEGDDRSVGDIDQRRRKSIKSYGQR